MDITPTSIKSIGFEIGDGTKYIIKLSNNSLYYYRNGDLSAMKDVTPDFNSRNLYDLVIKIAEKHNLTKNDLVINS